MGTRYIVLDFDGTCTQVDRIYAGFLTRYRELLEDANGKSRDELAPAWEQAQVEIMAASPHAGWVIDGSPSSAPAAADPYILSSEVAALLMRRKVVAQVPRDIYSKAYVEYSAPWRPEVANALAALDAAGFKIGFVSNSDKSGIAQRLTDLLSDNPTLRSKIEVSGGAAKYTIQELPVGGAGPGESQRARFEKLKGSYSVGGLKRPVYLRRAPYFDALCRMLETFGAGARNFKELLVCGDIFELDLALPKELGAQIHLITRAKPFPTYRYELDLAGPHISLDLEGLVARLTGNRRARPPK